MPVVIFPLGPQDDGYQELLQAAEAIERIAEMYHTRAVRGLIDETDTAYIGRLDAVAMVVRSCLQEEA